MSNPRRGSGQPRGERPEWTGVCEVRTVTVDGEVYGRADAVRTGEQIRMLQPLPAPVGEPYSLEIWRGGELDHTIDVPDGA